MGHGVRNLTKVLITLQPNGGAHNVQETMALTTWVRQNYGPRFPELEALIQNHMDYVRTVIRLGISVCV